MMSKPWDKIFPRFPYNVNIGKASHIPATTWLMQNVHDDNWRYWLDGFYLFVDSTDAVKFKLVFSEMDEND